MELTSGTVDTADTAKSAELPAEYPPSWIDRLTARLQKLPVPAWVIYVLAMAALVAIRTVIAWSDGSYDVGTFFKIHVLDGFTTIYLLLVLHYLDERANTALAGFRPALNVDASGYEKLRYQLTTMPARPVLIATIIGLAIGLIYTPLFDTAAEIADSKYFTSPAATIYDTLITGFSWLLNAVFAYHTSRQLRLVSQIYTRHTKVSIFDTGPLYALSRVTSMTTLALFVLTYVYLVLYGNGEIDTATNAIIAVIVVATALVTFVWPLFGAHRLLQDEKEERKGEIARRIEATADVLHARADAQDYVDMGNINNTIDGLVKEQTLVSKASTWPWDPEALRAVVTALLLPVVIWLITRLLERFGV